MHRDADKYMLRLPEGWRAAIKAKAAINRRSMNSEILAALEGVAGMAAGAEFGDQSPAAGKVHSKANQPEASSHAAE